METRKRLLFTGGEILSALWTGIALALDVSPLFPNTDLRIWALFGFIIFALIVLIDIAVLDNQLRSRTPKLIQTGEPYIKQQVPAKSTRGSKMSYGGVLTIVSHVKFVGVKYKNNPKYPTELNHALDVRAELMYYDKNGNVLVGPIDGRWSESDEPKKSTDIKTLIFTTMKSSGENNPLDLAVKFPGEKHFYAYNNKSYFAPENTPFRIPIYRIDKNEVIVRVKLRGSRVKFDKEYILKNTDDDIQVYDN